jgi:hypothetical protein
MNTSWNCTKGSVSANCYVTIDGYDLLRTHQFKRRRLWTMKRRRLSASAEPIQEEETLDNEEEVVNPEVVPEVRAASCQL